MNNTTIIILAAVAGGSLLLLLVVVVFVLLPYLKRRKHKKNGPRLSTDVEAFLKHEDRHLLAPDSEKEHGTHSFTSSQRDSHQGEESLYEPLRPQSHDYYNISLPATPPQLIPGTTPARNPYVNHHHPRDSVSSLMDNSKLLLSRTPKPIVVTSHTRRSSEHVHVLRASPPVLLGGADRSPSHSMWLMTPSPSPSRPVSASPPSLSPPLPPTILPAVRPLPSPPAPPLAALPAASSSSSTHVRIPSSPEPIQSVTPPRPRLAVEIPELSPIISPSAESHMSVPNTSKTDGGESVYSEASVKVEVVGLKTRPDEQELYSAYPATYDLPPLPSSGNTVYTTLPDDHNDKDDNDDVYDDEYEAHHLATPPTTAQFLESHRFPDVIVPSPSPPPSSDNIHRSDTRVVAQLIRSRHRKGDSGQLSRTDTTVSKIERAGSIREVVPEGEYGDLGLRLGNPPPSRRLRRSYHKEITTDLDDPK